MRSFFPTSPKRRSWTILVPVALVAGAVLLGLAAESRALDDITCLCRLALLTGSDRTATITASSDMLCWGMTPWDFRPLVESNSTIAWKLLTAMADKLR